MLEDQRRRLHFALPEAEPGYPRWSMTAFRFAGDYLDIIESLKAKRPVSDGTRGRTLLGLNRVMTGLLGECRSHLHRQLRGFTQSCVSVLCDHETPSRRQGGVGMAIKLDEETGRPSSTCRFARARHRSFDLTPIRHEFLARVGRIGRTAGELL